MAEVQKGLKARLDRRRERNRSIDIAPDIKSTAPSNETGVKGAKVEIFSSGADQKLRIQINGTWYEADLTAV